MKPSLPLSDAFLSSHSKKLDPVLSRFEKKGSIHSTLLITGIEGVGKKSLALHLIQTLFCDDSSGAKKPCQACKSCKRAIQNQWFDLFYFEPEMNDEETRLKPHGIENFRELKTKLGLGPSEEPFKVVLIADADHMTTQAANSILKMLEEPPERWIFILTASDSSRLLPTILSRCMEIRLHPLSSDQIYSILKTSKGIDFNSNRGKVASRAALGSLTRAMSYLDDSVWKRRDQVLGFLSNPTHEWMKLVESLALSQQELHLSLDLIESIFSDLLEYTINGESYEWIHHDQREWLIQFLEAKKLNTQKLSHVLEKTAEQRKLVNLTLNSKLLAQQVLIPILEVL
jgi:DNA polymerase-3 subunit delta'